MEFECLNVPDAGERLENLRKLYKQGPVPAKLKNRQINNHVHTKYSFSPYSPTYAVYKAYISGLDTVGIVDHDSFCGAEEFVEAGRIVGIDTSLGIELRVSYKDTPFATRKINHSDQNGMAFMLFHGVPYSSREQVRKYTEPIIEKRLKRDVKISENIGRLLRPHGIDFDFERNVLPISWYKFGGTVTERHILFGLADVLMKKFGDIHKVFGFLRDNFSEEFGFPPDMSGEDAVYYIMGRLKAYFLEFVYENADEELVSVSEATDFFRSVGAIPCYSYNGAVTRDITGDKKMREFEDPYLDELFEYFSNKLNIHALTYALTRNTKEQIRRIRELCEKHNVFEVCGDDINMISQSFVCEALKDEYNRCLITSSDALIVHERLASAYPEYGFESAKMSEKFPDVTERSEFFATICKTFMKSGLFRE